MQKTKKRFLSALLACAMIVSLFPFAAFAEDHYVAEVGSTPYTTFESAVNAASNGTSESPVTIKLLDNVQITEQVNLPANVILDGNGNTITANNDSWSTDNSAKYMIVAANDNTTVKNITLNGNNQASGCLQFYNANKCNMEDVTLQSAKQIGLMINTSNVTAKGNITLEGTFGWGNVINVGSRTTNVGSTFDVSGATLNNVAEIYADKTDVSTAGTSAISITTASSYVPLSDAAGISYVPTSSVEATVTSPEGGLTYYSSLQNALTNAEENSTVALTAGKAYDAGYQIHKSLKVVGAEGAVVSDITVIGQTGNENVSFEGITFNGASNAIHGDTNPSALYLQGVGSASVKNCVFDLAEGNTENTFAIVTGTTASTVVEDCTIDGYKTAGYHNPDTTADNSLNQSVTYKNNTIQNVPNGVAFVGTKTVVVEGNTFENSNGVRLEPSWETAAEPCTTATISENKFNVPDGENAFAVKTMNSTGAAGFTGSLNLNYNYWGSAYPDFDKLIQTNGNENINVVTDEYYKAPEMNESDLNTYYTGKYSYAINVANMDNGSVSVDKYAIEGEKVTLTVSPDKAYKLDELTVTANGKDVELTNNGDGTYTFTMPSSNVKVSATFVEDEDYVEPDNSITVSMTIGSNDFVINNNIVTVPDAAPYIANDRTYVPFRALGEALGAKVVWDNDARTVTYTLGDTEIVMTIGDTTYTINGVEKSMDVAPEITGDRTYVPVRFVAEGLGFKVTPLYADNGTTASVVFEK